MKTAIATLAIALTSMTSFAQEATVFKDNFVSTQTRAAVHATVLSALANGERLSWGESRLPGSAAPAPSILTRAEVNASVLAALANGERLSYGEANLDRSMPFQDAGSQAPTMLASSKTSH